MNRIRLLGVVGTVLLALLVAPVAWANMTMELNAGYAKSSEDVTGNDESLGGGLSFGAGFWHNASPRFSPGLEISYDNLGSIDADFFDPGTSTNYHEEFSTKVLRVAAQGRLNFGSVAGPSFFIQGGGGLYSASWDYKLDDTDASANVFDFDDSDSNFGFNIGAGVGFLAGDRTKVNFNAAYHFVPSIEVNNIDIAENMNYFQLRAGVGFNL